MKKAQGTLNWAVREMEARYQLFAGAKVRNIEGYNKLYPDKKMPYILLIVDEFADLMNVAAKEVEVLIQRLTQKARAAGIHLILATQRPSADVITGVIKSNIPSRIAFMVGGSAQYCPYPGGIHLGRRGRGCGELCQGGMHPSGKPCRL